MLPFTCYCPLNVVFFIPYLRTYSLKEIMTPVLLKQNLTTPGYQEYTLLVTVMEGTFIS